MTTIHNQAPKPERSFTSEHVIFEDGSSILSIHQPGDTIDLGRSMHKYFRNPLESPGGTLAFAGKDQNGRKLNALIIGDTLVVNQENPEGKVDRTVRELTPDQLNIDAEVTIGEPLMLPSGQDFAQITAVITNYKVGYFEQNAIPAQNPFVSAQATIDAAH